MKKAVAYVLMSAGLLIAGGCHNATPPALDGSRPALEFPGDDGAQPEAWLEDADPRYEGPEMSLRYSDGGVMITRDLAGTVGFIDIDNGATVEYNPAAGQLTVSGKAYAVKAETVAATDGAVWLRLTDSDGNIHLIVTEP